jgi:phosphoenolpyruvate-protein kinase (PTS system EI component)
VLVENPNEPIGFGPRDVVIARDPERDLAPLLWSAAGLVTSGGSASAHLFEVARARNIPAVCAVDIEAVFPADSGPLAVCVDGFRGTVATIPW